MNLTPLKTGLIAAITLFTLQAHGQDMLVKQAPIDRNIKTIDSLSLVKQLKTEQANVVNIYPGWNTQFVHSYGDVTIPESFKIDLTGFAMPTENTRITSNFGPRGRRRHNGLDIKVYVGDTIRAAFDGKIRIVKYEQRGYGKYVVIRHNNGLETIYGHLSAHLVDIDENVVAGQPIGLGGNTGRSTGSHLHFETRLLGVPINPAYLFDFEKQDVTADNYTFIASKNKPESTLLAKSEKGKKATYYKVKKGDTVYSVAKRQRMSVSQLCKINKISTKSKLKAGQTLRCS